MHQKINLSTIFSKVSFPSFPLVVGHFRSYLCYHHMVTYLPFWLSRKPSHCHSQGGGQLMYRDMKATFATVSLLPHISLQHL